MMLFKIFNHKYKMIKDYNLLNIYQDNKIYKI